MGSNLKNLVAGAILFLGIAFGVQYMRETKVDNQQIEYSQFIQQVKAGQISSLNIEGSPIGYEIKGERKDKTTFKTNAPMDDNLVTLLVDNKVRFKVTPEEKLGFLSSMFMSLLPVLLLIGAWMWFMRMQSGGGKGGAFGIVGSLKTGFAFVDVRAYGFFLFNG